MTNEAATIEHIRAALDPRSAVLITTDSVRVLLAAYDAIADGSAVRQARARERDALQRAGDAEVRASRAAEHVCDAEHAAACAAIGRLVRELDESEAEVSRLQGLLRTRLSTDWFCAEHRSQLALAMEWGREMAERASKAETQLRVLAFDPDRLHGPACPSCNTEDHPEHGCAGAAYGFDECRKPFLERAEGPWARAEKIEADPSRGDGGPWLIAKGEPTLTERVEALEAWRASGGGK